MSEIFYYDSFEPGRVIGHASELVDDALVEQWGRLYPWDRPASDGLAPPGLMSVLMMRIYQTVLARRPPGNIHGSQGFTLQALPRIGETINGTLRCLTKTPRGERRFVEFELLARGQDERPLFTGVMTMIWAA